MIKDAVSLQKICERFKFTEIIPLPVQKTVIASRSRILKSSLKKINKYSIWYGLAIFILLKVRLFGIKPSIAICKFAAITIFAFSAGGITTGTYLAIQHFRAYTAPSVNDKSASQIIVPQNSIPAQNHVRGQKNKITLYNGRVYEGIILSRGEYYIIMTSEGNRTIPSNQISLIERINK
jgi:hypothetical protein